MGKRQLEFYSSVVVVTGAGISARSGMPLFTAEEDWHELHPMQVLTRQAQPNDAHVALAEWERRVLERGGEFTLLTDNVDGLHQKAGSQNVVELRGSLHRLRCSCGWEEDRFWDLPLPACPRCGGEVRPDVVCRGEERNPQQVWRAKRALRRSDLFLAVGLAGSEPPASDFAEFARDARARTVLVSLVKDERACEFFDEIHKEAAEDFLPRIWEQAQEVTEPTRVRPESILQPARYALDQGLNDLAQLLDSLKVGYLALFDIADFKTRNHMLGYPRGDQDLEEFAEVAAACGVEGVVRYHQDQFIALTSRPENFQSLIETYRREEPIHSGYRAHVVADGPELSRTVSHELRICRALRGAYLMVFRGQPLENAIGQVAERVKYAPVDHVLPLAQLDRPYQAWSALSGKFSALHCPSCQGIDFEWEIGEPTERQSRGKCRGCGSVVEFENFS